MSEQKDATPEDVFELSIEIQKLVSLKNPKNKFSREQIFDALMIATQGLIGISYTAMKVSDSAPKRDGN